jgi:serine/threonine protein phosphatase PrpC
MAFEPNLLVLGHVGDCRCYRLRNGNLNLLTKDHTVASDLIRLKLILPKYSSQHPGRHQLTRSLGSNILLRADVMKEKVDSGDSFLLCSDGVWSNLNHDEIKKALLENKIDESLEHVLEKPLDCGAHDNITAILIRIK